MAARLMGVNQVARIRTIKPEFWSNDRLSELPVETHMFAAALLNYCDDEGYFHAHEKKLGIELFPLRDDYRSCTVHLQHLSKVGFITLHKGYDGRTYGHVVKFKQHQVINKPSASKIKHLVMDCESLRDDYGSATVVLRNGTWNMEQGIRNMEVEKEKEKEVEKTLPKKNKEKKIELPECINPKAWDDWLAYRKQRKLTCTEQTMAAQLRNLDHWHNQGHDPNAIIAKSIECGWSGLFEPKKNQSKPGHARVDPEEQYRQYLEIKANNPLFNSQELT